MNNFNWLAHKKGHRGWFAEDGHVPGSQGGSIVLYNKKRIKNILPEKGLSTDVRETVYADSISYKKSSSEKNRTKNDPKIIDVDFIDRDKKAYASPEFNKIKNKKAYASPEFNKIKNKKAYASPELKKMQEVTESKQEETKTSITGQQLYDSSNKFRLASKGVNDISSGFDKAYTHLHTAKNEKEDRSKKVESLSNEELRRVIERIKLNEEYNRVTSKKKSDGYHKTMAALAVLGSAATVTATGLSIAAGIKQLKNK